MYLAVVDVDVVSPSLTVILAPKILPYMTLTKKVPDTKLITLKVVAPVSTIAPAAVAVTVEPVRVAKTA